MRRWGQIAEAKPDAWYHDVATRVYLPDVYTQAAQRLIEEGKAAASDFPSTDGYRPPTSDFIDGVEYDGRAPNAYLEKFTIGLKGDERVDRVTSTH
jgi:nitrate/nitrite transport system substrate-binding protein